MVPYPHHSSVSLFTMLFNLAQCTIRVKVRYRSIRRKVPYLHYVSKKNYKNHFSVVMFITICLCVSDRTSGVAAEGWKVAPDAGKVPRLGQPDRRGAGAG